MPKFSSGYGSKSNIVDNDKILIADSEAADEIKSSTKAALEKSLTGGTLANSIYKTTSGSYAKPAKLKYIIVEVQAGGGGGGGAALTAGNASAGGGGGAGGGYAKKKILASALAASEFVTVGAGGTAGPAGQNNGGGGGSSSFGSLVSATGGGGGNGGGQNSANTGASGGAGGTGSLGDINIMGESGKAARVATGNIVAFGNGGNSVLGFGGQTSANDAQVGQLYGGGGTGRQSSWSNPALAGAAGGAGIVIIHEYF